MRLSKIMRSWMVRWQYVSVLGNLFLQSVQSNPRGIQDWSLQIDLSGGGSVGRGVFSAFSREATLRLRVQARVIFNVACDYFQLVFLRCAGISRWSGITRRWTSNHGTNGSLQQGITLSFVDRVSHNHSFDCHVRLRFDVVFYVKMILFRGHDLAANSLWPVE